METLRFPRWRSGRTDPRAAPSPTGLRTRSPKIPGRFPRPFVQCPRGCHSIPSEADISAGPFIAPNRRPAENAHLERIATPRPNEFSRRVQQLALARQKQRCALCGTPISSLGDAGKADHQYGEGARAHHRRHIKLGGLASVDNCVIICESCHYSVHEGGNYRLGTVVGEEEDYPTFMDSSRPDPLPKGDRELRGLRLGHGSAARGGYDSLPKMRVLHTSDWHLGHTLHDLPRDHEQLRFLDWLGAVLANEEVDALLVAGDIFDTANPSAEAQRLWYAFLARTRERLPQLDIVIVAGNHDSPARLEAPGELLAALRIHVVGLLPRAAAGTIDADRVLAPLTDRSGRIGAWVAAVPFLRPADLPVVEPEEGVDPLVEGVRQVYAEVLAEGRRRLSPGQALVAMGHSYMVGTRLSDESERKILGGNQHALPASIFPDDLTYAALGHLHLAQAVGDRACVRYSGSPLPLSMAEAGYPHQVCLVDFEDGKLTALRTLRVPRTVELLRIPASGSTSRESVIELLAALPAAPPGQESLWWPYLEVAVHLDGPEPATSRGAGRPCRPTGAYRHRPRRYRPPSGMFCSPQRAQRPCAGGGFSPPVGALPRERASARAPRRLP